ncbi:hypothetical protein [Ferrimicrobium acidiphilum]|uniref:hypothetical protein n=1 Tax=Ferrimicrobium acidiphilum TaxID=121039 RepID=UPI0023F5643B|nr:hypothetical protein [Ferrimicrobium acidiphilum]
MTQGLSDPEISRVVNRYLGLSSGYLGSPDRFSCRTYADFYTDYCDLDVSLAGHEGMTREVFISVLASLSPRDQAKVLCGVIERFPQANLAHQPPGKQCTPTYFGSLNNSTRSSSSRASCLRLRARW